MSEWIVDLEQEQATHPATGVRILFSGDPDSNYFDGKPTGFPEGMTVIEQSHLIRTGFDEYRTKYRESSPKRRNHRRPQITQRKRRRTVLPDNS